jgi:hypothetical protein
VNVVAARELAGAWELLARLQIIAYYAEEDLCRELLAQGDFAAF